MFKEGFSWRHKKAKNENIAAKALKKLEIS